MTQNTEYIPKKDTDDVNEDEDVDKGKKRKHPPCQSNEEEEPKLKKKPPPLKEGERKLTKSVTTMSNINSLSATKKMPI